MRTFAVAALACALGLFAAPTHAQNPVADFYKGKDVQVVIGADVGGSYGLYGQLIVRHLKKHIPGQPNLVLQAMPGAGGLKALGYTYNAAPRDGSVLTIAHAEVLFETLLVDGNPFNAKDYTWIGRLMDADFVGLVTRKSGVTSLDDVKKKQVIVGATGVNSVTAVGPQLFNEFIGTKFKMVPGYKGTNEIFFAMEKGEADSIAVSWVTAAFIQGEKLKSGELIPIYAVAGERLKELPKVPNVTEFARNATEKAFVDIYTSSALIGRALAVPPQVPADRIAALRTAFQAMVKDPEFLKDAKEKNIPLNLMTGEKLNAEVARIMATPKDTVNSAKAFYKKLLEGIEGQK
jgi:tripartite-type tricarboxylate transporter receptor subunit TctC